MGLALINVSARNMEFKAAKWKMLSELFFSKSKKLPDLIFVTYNDMF